MTSKNTKICVVAGDKILKNDKVFRPYLDLVNIKTEDFMKVNQIKKDVELFIIKNVKPDKDGKYIGKYSRTKTIPSSHGSGKNNDILIEGGIEMLKRDLHEHLVHKYGNKIIGSYQSTRVHVNGKNVPIYSNFDLSQLSLECEN
jgi:hypothetical protein